MLRLRPGILFLIVLVFGVWLWQTQFREYSLFSESATDHSKQVEFKRYALDYYPIQELKFVSDNELWVRLNKGNNLQTVDIQRVVDDIADDYQTRTGIAGGFTVFMLHPIHQDVVARTTR